MSRPLGNKKLDLGKGGRSAGGSKPPVNGKKDEMKSFMDAEWNKLQSFKKTNNNISANNDPVSINTNLNNNASTNKNPSNFTFDANKSVTNMKESLKKIKDLNTQAKVETSKNDDVFRTSQTKFIIPELRNLNNNILNKTPDETFNTSHTDFNKSSQLNSSISKPKTPFTIKKFETNGENPMTKEIINDITKGETVSLLIYYFSLKLEKEEF